jgi:hypothetical protein
MTMRTRSASWFVSSLLLIVVVSAGFELVVAQPQDGASRPAFDASEVAFVSLGGSKIVNINNIAYTNDDGRVFDIFFACSSTRGSDPLRLTDAKEISHARSFFGDENRHGRHFEKYSKDCINPKHIAYMEYKNDSVIIYFNARIGDAFVQVTLFGADAESFRKKRGEF